MKRLQDFILNDHEIFGPGTDLVISLVAVLVIMLAINTSSYQQELGNLKREKEEREKQEQEGQLNIRRVKESQMEIIQKIAQQYNTPVQEMDGNCYGISVDNSNNNDIVIENDVTLQRIRFGSHILFDIDDANLKYDGKKILIIVGNIFKLKLKAIKEIQIQGHADIRKTSKYSSNLELAAHRAIAVFEFLKQEVYIDPVQHIMSATTFGEYKPVQRTYSAINYNDLELKQDNATDEERLLNRRIEIVLIYRQED